MPIIRSFTRSDTKVSGIGKLFRRASGGSRLVAACAGPDERLPSWRSPTFADRVPVSFESSDRLRLTPDSSPDDDEIDGSLRIHRQLAPSVVLCGTRALFAKFRRRVGMSWPVVTSDIIFRAGGSRRHRIRSRDVIFQSRIPQARCSLELLCRILRLMVTTYVGDPSGV